MDDERAPENQDERTPEELRLRQLPRAGLLLFGTVLCLFGAGSLFGARLEYANFVGQQVLAPLALVIGAIMIFAGARGRVWS